MFGPAVQRQLAQLRVFLVGAGALGCEFLKNFAMMGVSTSSGGQVCSATCVGHQAGLHGCDHVAALAAAVQQLGSKLGYAGWQA